MAVMVSISVLVFIFKVIKPGECTSDEQASFQATEGIYLANHVIETKHTETGLECGMQCLSYASCASVNYKISGIGKGRCELNKKTLQSASGSTMHNPEFKHFHIAEKVRKTIL